ncbi:hypothetical protein N2K95_04810 [Arthrobacter zhaoxinii]|uniref:Peptidase n=1 Tax=Arthrobacter zhaoxinii TaxID=2964616 RepID=A0ABY5YWG9_9MICC|nr:hypothetical protein [Arthrobacter zhaoxinii]UWX97995.1 hypothetical protein N2K95_04810 [Arthrobacter zhaoxinii]
MASASAVLALAGTLALVGAPSARASNNYLEFSPDGNRYGPTIAGPLFNESLTYVPGAEQAATVWVRNNSADPARLSSAAVMVRSDPELNGYLGLAAESASSSFARAPLGTQGACADLPATWDLAGGEEIELTFAVDLSIDAPNATMNRTAEFNVLFYLESTDAGQAPRPACDALGNGTGDGSDNGDNGTDVDDGTVAAVPRGETPAVVEAAGAGAQSIPPPGPATGSLAILPGSGTSSEPQAVAAAAVSAPAAAQVPKGTAITGAESSPPVLDAMVQSTVEPVIRSMSGTLLIAMSVAFTAAVVLRVWSRRYE